jgi:hypothetical protein
MPLRSTEHWTGAAYIGRAGEASREHYARLYAQPGAMHAGFNQFAAFDQDAIDNKAFVAQGKLTMPVLAVGGEKSFGATPTCAESGSTQGKTTA